MTMQENSSQISITNSVYQNQDDVQNAFNVWHQMRQKSILCDVTLIVENVEISANKMLLAGFSPYFSAMFSNFKESEQKTITLQEISAEALSLLVDYMYTLRLHITEENIQDLLVASNFLQMTNIRNACGEFLESRLNPTNCLGTRALADMHNCIDLANKAQNYTLRYFQDIIKSEEFLLLSHQELSRIISSDLINVSCEEKVFEAILIWVKHDLSSRQIHLASLLENVRIFFLPQRYLLETVLEEPLLKNDLRCKDFIIEAFACQVSKGDTKYLTNVQRIKPRLSSKLLLVLGGYMTENSVECYDFVEQRWTKMTHLPLGRYCAGTVVLNGKVYVMGGLGGNIGIQTVAGGPITRNHTPQRRVDVYNTATMQWSRGVDMTTERSGVGVATIGNCIYAIGGQARFGYLNTMEMYNTRTRELNVLAPMSIKRHCIGVGVIENLLYVVGGSDGTTPLNSVECYNPETNTWTHVKQMNSPRSGVCAAVLNGLLYAAGGRDGTTSLKSVEVFDPKSNTWTLIADMHYSRAWAGAVAANNRLYVIGGSKRSNQIAASVEVYDPETNRWSILPNDMSIGRRGACAVVIDKPA